MNIGPYTLDNIYCGDSAVMLAALPDACIDLTVTSPPYDNLRAYNGYSWDFDAIATQLYRVTKPGGVVVWVVGDATVNGSETGSSFRQALGFMEIGFNLHDTMIYNKDSFRYPQDNVYHQVFEYMFVFSKDKPKTINFLIDRKNIHVDRNSKNMKRESDGSKTFREKFSASEYGKRYNIWKYAQGKGGSTNDIINHPAIFPEALARDHIISWSNPGDIILDPFAGSGTTAKMSKVLSRHWLGFDISQEYVDLANRRVAAANVPLPLFVEQPQPKPTQEQLL